MFIIAGCYAKYRCLSDIYSLDLTPLLETGSTKDLIWTERKPKDISYITRWGHSSTVYDNKVYIFAGRFSNDLNDIQVFDPQNNTLKVLKLGNTSNEAPKARRRHCAGFVGSCLIIFGGFNGEYFNDLYYINVFELVNKIDSTLSL
jgi:N-acetylneuraminic acid mutarotase